jgi:hypothetical protein
MVKISSSSNSTMTARVLSSCSWERVDKMCRLQGGRSAMWSSGTDPSPHNATDLSSLDTVVDIGLS